VNEKKLQAETKKIIGKGRRALRYGVNIFVYAIVGIFMLLVVFFGISQTSIFKDWLRDTVVELVNDGINGKLSIEEIDGTIFTSLLIKNVTLTSLQNDTVVSAGNIELRTSPLKILFKNIYVRKFELKDARVKLVEEEDGQLNLLKIFPPSDEPEDTTSSEFPFSIEVADFALTNIDFSLQRYDKVGSTENYQSLNTEDLRVKNLNVSLSAFADLNKYNYRLTINNISFSPNFNFFQLENLSGTILLTPQLAGINKLHLVTRDSEIKLNAAVLGVDFIKDFSIEKLEAAPVRFNLSSPRLKIDDITTYVPALEMLDGTVAANLEGSGTFSDLQVKKLNLDYNNTSLNATGRLENLLNADKMNFDLSIMESYVDPSDPNKLLRNVEIPEYKEFGVIYIDTLNFKGGPLDFKTNFALRTDNGNMSGNANMNLLSSEIVYEVNVRTKNFDLGPFTSIPTNLNSRISVNGIGFNPQNMELDLSMNAVNSRFGTKDFDDLNITSTAKEGIITTSLTISSDSTSTDMLANLDFNNPDDPTYDIKGKLKKVNLAKFLNNESLDSELNLSLQASGQGFDPDSMDVFLVTDIQDSRVLDFDIDSTRLIMDIRRNDNGKKIINVISDIADLTISGDYALTSIGDVLSRESEIITSAINEKINPIFNTDTLNSLDAKIVISEDNSPTKDFSLEYLLDFKQFMNLNLGQHQLELDGMISGNMESLNDSFIVSLNSKLDYLKYWNDRDVFFLVNTNFDCNLSNQLLNTHTDNLAAAIELNSERIYAGGNIYDLNARLNLSANKLSFAAATKYENDISADINSNIVVTDGELKLNINKLNLTYKDFNISNNNDLLLTYLNENISLDNWLLNAGDGKLNIDGSFGPIGDHNLSLSLNGLSGERVVDDILGKQGQNKFNSDINVKALISGNFGNPKFSINASAENITYAESNFGSLISVFDYENNRLNTDIRLIDSSKNYSSPAMLITGFLPLALTASKDSIDISDNQIELVIESDEFDLSSLKKIIPYVQFNKGKLETDIYITGTVSKPVAIGYFSINEANFKLTNNNLDYDFNAKVWIDDEDITLESITLQNEFGTKQGGTLKGEGLVKLDEFKLDSTLIKINGDLKVLDDISKSSNPLVYGDVAFKTRGDIVYSSKGGNSYVNLPISITVADIIIPLAKSAYSSSSGFKYEYVKSDKEVDKLISELDSLIRTTQKKDSVENNKNGVSKFNYTLDIDLDTEAEVVVILSKELDQNLVAILGGNFFLESIDGKTRSGGQLKLLEGSSLSFIKTFSATGSVRFDKIDNPIIDITSTYKSYWLKIPDDPSSEQEVGIKIKLKGPLSELNQNFINDENNIGVYIGRQDIEDDRKDASKNATDAMFFIITGKFPADANQQDINLVGQYTADIAGSLIGGVLNQYFGDYVTGFQLRQVTNNTTKFNLIGKVWKIKYEIGGSTEVLQDLSRANVKMEYPITERLQLRVERKESENQTTSSINNPLFFEGGFKYNFEF
jgi:hypothetical protein